MADSQDNYGVIRERLNKKVQCPYRLFPARILALSIAVNRDLISEVQKKIANRIPDYLNQIGWYKQFLSDLDTYGLYEAILYFHTYPFPSSAESFINDACDFYTEIASLYLAHHDSIVNSDDPRIQSQLGIIRHRGGDNHHVFRFQRAPLDKPKLISPPVCPPDDPKYRRRLPMHEDIKSMIGAGGNDGVRNLADELVEHLDARFMFEDFPGFQLLFFEIAEFLGQFQIDPFSSTGQYVLQTIIEHINDEYYGDYDRVVECIKCGEEYVIDLTLETANLNLLQGGWACEECRGSLD